MATKKVEPKKQRKPKVFRSYAERIAEIDKKIAFHEEKISLLKVKRAKTRGNTNAMDAVMKAAKNSGLTAEEIASKLGVKI